MTRISRRTVTIGPEEFRTTCDVPRANIGWWEVLALTARGWLDARRNRGVGDAHATHTLYRVEAAYRRNETESVRRIDQALSAIDRELAPLLHSEQVPLPDAVAVPTPSELDTMDDASRLLWAQRVKQTRSANAEAEAARQGREKSALRIAELRSIREALGIEGDDVRRQWADGYRIRAACYTRARFGRRFMEMHEAPAVPDYVAALGPTVVRAADAGLASAARPDAAHASTGSRS